MKAMQKEGHLNLDNEWKDEAFKTDHSLDAGSRSGRLVSEAFDGTDESKESRISKSANNFGKPLSSFCIYKGRAWKKIHYMIWTSD